MSARQIYFEDLTVGQIDNFGSYPVTREDVIAFATKFDPQSFHIDDAAAAANPVFGRISASALHTMAMTGRMLADRSKDTGLWAAAGLGLEEMRVLKPVFPEDVLRVETEITHLRESKSQPDMGIVTMRVRTLNQHDEPVMQFFSVQMFKRRAPAPAA